MPGFTHTDFFSKSPTFTHKYKRRGTCISSPSRPRVVDSSYFQPGGIPIGPHRVPPSGGNRHKDCFALCLVPKCLKAHQPIPEHKTGKDLRLVLHRGALWIVCHVQECFLHDVGIIHCTLDGSGLRRAKPFHQSGVVPNDHRGDGGRIFTAASVSHLVLSELITTFVVGSGVILRNCSKIRGGVILSRIFFLQSSGEAI